MKGKVSKCYIGLSLVDIKFEANVQPISIASFSASTHPGPLFVERSTRLKVYFYADSGSMSYITNSGNIKGILRHMKSHELSIISFNYFKQGE